MSALRGARAEFGALSKLDSGPLDLFGRAGNHAFGLSRRPVCPPCEAKQREFTIFGYHADGRVR